MISTMIAHPFSQYLKKCLCSLISKQLSQIVYNPLPIFVFCAQPLGAEDAVLELPTEVASVRNNNAPSINSSVAPGGTLSLIPVSTSTNNNNDRNIQRRVSTAPANNNVNGAVRALGDISFLMVIMNCNTRVIL